MKIDEIINFIKTKTGRSLDESFITLMVLNKISQMASHMRIKIEMYDGTKVPCNMYSCVLAPSGYSKGLTNNILEDDVFKGFRDKYEEVTYPFVAEGNVKALASKKALKEGMEEDEALDVIMKRYNELPSPLYDFKEATDAGLKGAREKYTMTGIGGTNMSVDEIAYSLEKLEDVFSTLLETFDMAKAKDKLIKVNSNGASGSIPSTLMMFGSPSSLLNGSNNEHQFINMLRQGFARRTMFSLIKDYKNNEKESAKSIIERSKLSKTSQSDLNDYFIDLADKDVLGTVVTMSDELSEQLLDYKSECEMLSDNLKDHQDIEKFEMSHRYWKVLKIVGLLAFSEKRSSSTKEDLDYAINLAEESGKSFKDIMKRDANYVRLFKYLVDVGHKVTDADLYENLQFYASSNNAQRKDMKQLASAHAYNNNGFLRETAKNGVVFLEAEKMKETDLAKLTLSYSNDMTEGYNNDYVDWTKLPQLLKANELHYCTHHFTDGYRDAEHAITGFDVIALDLDKDVSMELVGALMSEYEYIMQTTKRHTSENHRFRLLLPMKFRMKLNEEDFKTFMENVFEVLPFETDSQTKNISRKWLSNPNAEIFRNAGVLFDPTDFIPDTQKSIEFKKNMGDMSDLDALERYFMLELSHGATRNNLMLRFATMLVDGGLGYEEIELKTLALNDKIDPPLPFKELNSTVFTTVRKKLSTRE